MLNVKNNFLKIMFAIFVYVFWGLNPAFGMEYSKVGGYAKVVFLGNFRAGKTVLYNLLSHKTNSLQDTQHTRQISVTDMEYDINGKKVQVYLGDTSAEPGHKKVMDEFCKNAHIIFVIVNAKELVESNGLNVTTTQKYFERLLCDLPDIAPNCRVIVVLTQKDKITKNMVKDAPFIKRRISEYIRTIEEVLHGDEETNNINIDAKYELTLKDTVGKEAMDHRRKIEDLIKNSIISYGIENLPSSPEGFVAEVTEETHTVVDQKNCILPDKTHEETTYSLNVK